MTNDSSQQKIPSLNELLNHPKVQQIVARVNQTTIAQRATGFLDELQTNLRQRVGQGGIPPLGQLAERFARRLLGPATICAPVINATGVVVGKRWPALPLAEVAVNEIVRLSTEYHLADEELLARSNALLVELTSAEASWVATSFDAALEIAREVGGDRVSVARCAGVVSPAEFGLAHYETLGERIASGAELVVCDGAGLLGGPRCGIVLGKRARVQKVAEHSLARHVVPDTLSLAALTATLGIYQAQDRVNYQIPLWQLLSTPLENLEQRCHRLAALMVESELIAEATATRCDSAWCDSEELKVAGPTWAIHLKPARQSATDFARTLSEASPQLIARTERDELWLDLRSVFPRWDQQLVAEVDGKGQQPNPETA